MNQILRRPAVPAFALCLVTMAVYCSTAAGQFTVWDDKVNIYANPHYLPVTWASTVDFWLEQYNHTYRPLVHMAWALMVLLSRSSQPLHIPGAGTTFFDARVFHAFNLLFHLVNVLLVWRLARLWVKNDWAAAGGALVFAVHPVQVESVGWITGFNELFCGTLCLLSTGCYLRFAMAARDGKPGGSFYAGSVLLFALALLTKPAAVALPVMLWMFDVWGLGTAAIKATQRLGGWVAAALLWAALSAGVHPEDYSGAPPPLWQRPFVAGDAFTFYLYKLALPFNLCIDYGRKPSAVLAWPEVWVEWIVPLLVIAVAWILRPRTPWPLLAVGTAIAWLIPVCGLKPFHFQLFYSTVADRYLYFALLGTAFAVARGLEAVATRPNRSIICGGYGILVAAWCLLSFEQGFTWTNNFTLFGQAARVTPTSWMARANLGAAYDEEGNYPAAADQFVAALAINPSLWQMHVKLARYAGAAGRPDIARQEWDDVLRLNPGYPEAVQTLANLNAKTGKPAS